MAGEKLCTGKMLACVSPHSSLIFYLGLLKDRHEYTDLINTGITSLQLKFFGKHRSTFESRTKKQVKISVQYQRLNSHKSRLLTRRLASKNIGEVQHIKLLSPIPSQRNIIEGQSSCIIMKGNSNKIFQSPCFAFLGSNVSEMRR